MIAAIKSNPVTTFWGILTVISEVLRANPSLLDFLPSNVSGYIFGSVSVLCAIITAISTRDVETLKQSQAKTVAKKMDRLKLKEEIKKEIITITQKP